MEPKVSVIIPVYNAQRHLEQCLNSVLGQTLQDFEIICVDDGSTDQSLQILQRYAQRDRRVSVLTQENQYAGVARNHGMAAAKGKYVAFLDADDFFFPRSLERLYSIAEKHRLDMVKGGFVYLNVENGRQYKTLDSVNSGIGWLDRRRVISFEKRPLRLLTAADVPWNGLYRRDFVERNGIQFNSLICVNDHSFFIHCLLKAERLMVTRIPVACYRIAQADSIIGKKANHFDAQIASYQIVRALSQSMEQAKAQAIMRNELNHLFSWYQRLRPGAQNGQDMDRQMSEFLREFDEDEVGRDFLATRSYWTCYWELRYGTPPPPQKRANPVKRVGDCWREHGWQYTLLQLGNRLRGKQ